MRDSPDVGAITRPSDPVGLHRVNDAILSYQASRSSGTMSVIDARLHLVSMIAAAEACVQYIDENERPYSRFR